MSPGQVHLSSMDLHLRAIAKLLVDSGDMTPQGRRVIEAALDEHYLDLAVTPAPRLTRRVRRAWLLKRRGETA